MRKPSITSRCVANRYNDQRNETIAEFHSGRHGGLMSLRRVGDTDTVVELYRLDDGIKVRVPPDKLDYTPGDWMNILIIAQAKVRSGA